MTRRLSSCRRDGWSLIETLIVVALGGILSTMSISYMIAAHPHAELERGELEVSRALMDARNTAISHETQTRVTFNLDASEYWVSEYDRVADSWSDASPHYELSDEVTFKTVTFAQFRVVYTPRGTLVTGGSITLENSKLETSILTGSVATGRFQLTGGNLR